MPTIKYSDNPNEETAFVTQDGGQRNRAVLTAAVSGTIKYPDNPNSTKVTVTVDGVEHKAIAVYNLNDSGDSHNKGYYATQAALEEAVPTGEAGDYAVVGATDTVWIWDEDTSAWVDSDQKGQVVSVNSKTGTVVLDAFDVDAVAQFETLPAASQANAGKVVHYVGTTSASYTNGYFYKNIATTTTSSATASQTAGSSLTDVAVVVATFETQITTSGSYVFTSDGADWSYDGNVVDLTDYGITYTGTPVADDTITVVYTAESISYAWTRVDVQPNNLVDGSVLTVKNDATSQHEDVEEIKLYVRYDGSDGTPATIKATHNGFLILGNVQTGDVTPINSTKKLGSAIAKWDRCFVAKLNNGANIDIPNIAGEMAVKSVNTTVTLAAANWSLNTQTVSVTGITATGVVFVSPDPSDQADYTSAGILCTTQAAGTLTFTCDTTPSNDIDVVVVMM